jgi:hypothetical protein
MVASDSFKELSEVFARLESSGTKIRHAEIDQDLSDTDSDVTAELTVTLPFLTDVDMGETASIDAEGADIKEGEVSVDLTVTVSDSDSKRTGQISRRSDLATTDNESSEETVPAYKNPDALKAVYEQYSSFPEMTEALGVDVTSETVRRHMVKYEIHDPDDTRPNSYMDTATIPGAESESPADSDVETDVVAADDQTDTSSNRGEEVPTQKTTSAVTDGGNETVDDTIKESHLSNTSVKELVAEVSSQQGADQVVRTNIDIPETLTVAELADAINQSQTVRDVTRHIGVNRSAAKQFLKKFGLIDFVSHRLAADQITVSPDEVVRRINRTNQ